MKKLALTLVLAMFLSSCQPTPPPMLWQVWSYSQVRSLDPVDAIQPAYDLVAAYTRQAGAELQVRLDMLNLDYPINFDLYLALDTGSGGRYDLPLSENATLSWDAMVVIPASGEMQALNPSFQPIHGAALRLVRDPRLDTLTLSLNSASLSPVEAYPFGKIVDWQVEVLLVPAGSNALADRLGPFHTDASPPPPVSVLFAFWKVYPAYTPALALRRWDGAHTGPSGGRHGLNNLLRTAQNAGIPVFLLDLKQPAALSALDYAGYLRLVQEMSSRGELVLPTPLPDEANGPSPLSDWAIQRAFNERQAIAADFNLPASPFAFAPSGGFPSQAQVIFTRSKTSSMGSALQEVIPLRWRDKLVVPVPGYAEPNHTQQAELDGPTLELRRALVDSALSTSSEGLLILGGELPASTWGDPRKARATFHYLNSRPWIHLVDSHDILAWHPGTQNPDTSNPQVHVAPSGLLACLQTAPQNRLAEAAWRTFISLYAPVYPTAPELPALRRLYLGHVWSLLEAAKWAEVPTPRADCSGDPDRDGQTECVLASENVFALFEIESGALLFLFARQPDSPKAEIHQLIGPSSQMIVGLSEPSTWDLSGASEPDPWSISGAFAEQGMHYQGAAEGETIVFASPDGSQRKSYHLQEAGLSLVYEAASARGQVKMRIPLVYDSWERFSPGWSSTYNYSPAVEVTSLQWAGTSIQTAENPSLTSVAFNDSQNVFALTEDPNLDYPPGHFLPFPMALVEIEMSEHHQVMINLAEKAGGT